MKEQSIRLVLLLLLLAACSIPALSEGGLPVPMCVPGDTTCKPSLQTLTMLLLK